MKLLKSILRYKRPHGSGSENAFIHRFLDSIPGIYSDVVGNRILKIGTSPILWSCHTDTVHRKEGLQKVFYKKNMLRSNGTCLGADDGAGIWLMLKMIKRRVPGLYIFHRGEEVGGIGSMHIANNSPNLLKAVKYAIALDRRGYTDVITHQGSRCCSDKFGDSLAKELGMEYTNSTRGSFTDTANYTDIVGECTNLSVGYFNQHSTLEYQDTKFLVKLLNALINVNPDNLVESRKAGDYESLYNYGNYDYRDRRNAHCSYNSNTSYNNKSWDFQYDTYDDDDELQKLTDAMDTYPLATARILRDHGVTSDDIREEAVFSVTY